MEVHKRLGDGFLEAVYHEALAVEFTRQQIPFESEVRIPILYRQVELQTRYRADFICFNQIVVEIKAIKSLSPIEKAPLLHYLKATSSHLGLLINFGSPSLQYKRFINTP
jgi:GxxExxY protein